MKVLTEKCHYEKTIKMASNLKGTFDKQVIFHCYWNGVLSVKHFYSILSCYYFNVFNNKHKIILWLENNTPNEFNEKISDYCEVKQFSLEEESEKTEFLKGYTYNFKDIKYYSDYVRLILLYNYGGCWFDLDCFFLRSFDPLFTNYGKEICLHAWGKTIRKHKLSKSYPGNGIIICLEQGSAKLKSNMEFIIKHNKGWGFQEAKLVYTLPLDFLVLPCCWFSPEWIPNPYHIGTLQFLQTSNKKYNFDNFFKGAFCYHWHNKWDMKVENNSIIEQLAKIIEKNLEL